MPEYNSVPEISLSDYHDPTKRETFCADLYAGLKYYGFIILRDHGIAEDLLEDAYAASQSFFALPDEEKSQYIREDVSLQRGYAPIGREHAKGNPFPDLKELWHIGRSFNGQETPPENFPQNIWPERPKNFKSIFLDLYKALDEAGQIVLEALTPSLGVAPAYFKDLAKEGSSLLRLLHYPPLMEGADPRSIRAAAHEDINLLTMLVAASSSGLELLDKDGNWLAVNGSRNAIIVDAGDMLARITNNVIPATTHRVVNPVGPNTSRYSMPFFIHPKPDVYLSCIEAFRNGQEEDDIIANDFLQQRLSEIGLKKA